MDSSQEEVRKIGGGRLKRQSSEDHITISSDLDLQPLEDLIKPKKQKKSKKDKQPKQDENGMSIEKPRKTKAPRKKIQKQTEGEEEQPAPKQQRKLKKVVESNDAIMERLKNNPLFQGEEDEPKPRDQESSVASIRTDEEDAPKKKKGGGKKPNGISMRHKFFKSFDDELPPTEEPVNLISLDDQDIYDERLVFQQENPAPRDDVQKKMNDQVQQYKNKLAVFDGEQPQPQPKKQQDLLKRMQSMPTEVEYQPDELEINLIMPSLGSRDAVIDGTLYLNKMKNKINFQSRTISQVNLSNSKSYSRSEFLKRMNQKINERGGRNISMDSLLNKFQKTELEQIVQEKERKKQKKLGDIDEHKNDEDESSPDEEFKPEDVKDDTGEDSRKALEDSQNEVELVKNSGEEAEAEIEDNKSEDSQKSHISRRSNQSHYTIESQSQSDAQQLSQSKYQSPKEKSALPSTLEDVPKSKLMVVNSGESEQDEEIDEEELKMFTRLRKISQAKRIKKLKEQEKIRRKEEKRKEMDELRKKVSANFIEEEAELGSDDENHDDVVKPKENDNDDDEQDDQYLEGLIDDELAEIDEDNEERAYRMYLQRQNQEEKEQLRKILRGEFKVGNRERDALFMDALNIHNSEAARLARMEECMRRLQSKDAIYDEIDEDEEIESAIKNPLLDRTDLKQQLREERLYHDQMKIRNFIAQNKQQKLDEELVGLLGNRAVQRIAQKQQTMAPAITTKPQQKPIYGLVPQRLNFGQLTVQPQPKIFNSFLNRTLQDQNKPENNHSNSISQMKKNKPSSYPLNKLFASCVQNGNMGTKLQKSPNKLLLFGQKKK